MLPATQPTHNQIEVTLLGPGYGECVLLHYGGDWLIVDSCKHLNQGPAAIKYLNLIGAPLSQVKQVACTHWHDDHCGGLSEMYRQTPNADLIISAALEKKEFIQLIQAFAIETKNDGTSGLDEIYKTFKIAKERDKRPVFARSDQLLWRSDDSKSELYSLSPCDGMITESMISIARLMPQNWDIQRPIVAKDNHVSIAMIFKAGNHSILLGSDLEETGKTKGWSTIITGNRRPLVKCSLYKVAHHGSETGEHPGIWRDLLVPHPTSIVTPFSKLKDPLPRKTDRERIRKNSSDSYLTTDVIAKRIKRSGAIAKLAAPRKLQILHPQIGAIRCRLDVDSPKSEWMIETSTDVVKI